jgi:hypothetical protein
MNKFSFFSVRKNATQTQWLIPDEIGHNSSRLIYGNNNWSSELKLRYRPRNNFNGESINSYYYLHGGSLNHTEQGNLYFRNDALGEHNIFGWSRANIVISNEVNIEDIIEMKYSIVNDTITRTITRCRDNFILEQKSYTDSRLIGASFSCNNLMEGNKHPYFAMYDMKIDDTYIPFNESSGDRFYSTDRSTYVVFGGGFTREKINFSYLDNIDNYNL